MEPRPLSARFVKALAFAAAAHGGQARKGTDTPYIAHLLGVAAIVLEHGGDEDQAVAALLHDAVEDQGGDTMRGKIETEFGARVTMMVDDCTDAAVQPKPPWKERKVAYIEHLAQAHHDSLLVSMADKLYNAAAITRDVRRHGLAVFERFKAGPDDVVWYYRSLVAAFAARELDGAARELLEETTRAVDELVGAVDEAVR